MFYTSEDLGYQLTVDEQVFIYLHREHLGNPLDKDFTLDKYVEYVAARREREELRDKFPHYYKKIPFYQEYLDVYDVLALFNVTCSRVQHAVKKLLCLGNRGVKDKYKDLSEASSSIKSALTAEKLSSNFRKM
jgi:hypothetical protein